MILLSNSSLLKTFFCDINFFSLSEISFSFFLNLDIDDSLFFLVALLSTCPLLIAALFFPNQDILLFRSNIPGLKLELIIEY
tara:strand:- start:259 stop:504 length:246 start_codon:yes stop_codon:yes gene_type:complete